MDKVSIFWATNLRHLRQRLQWSQDELAERLGITRSKLNAHENGNTINPTAEDLIRFSGYFKMSIDSLLKIDLTQLSETKIKELESGNDGYASGSKLRVLATTVDAKNNENIEFVPIRARAGYIAGHSDPEFIAALPKFTLPHLPQNRSYRMFPTVGDSMLPIPEGCFVIAEYVQDWLELKDGILCILILKSSGNDFVFKKVENRIKTNRTLMLHSLNENYTPYEVAVGDVLEIWKYVNYVSDTIPAGNISMMQIAKSLKEIQVDLGKLSAQK
ncbi:MAG: LexA family transcriptional regulator [Bacteroidetes bacterium]|nr:LexA family transcriptional regulator [Bacteroidota bacterium]